MYMYLYMCVYIYLYIYDSTWNESQDDHLVGGEDGGEVGVSRAQFSLCLAGTPS